MRSIDVFHGDADGLCSLRQQLTTGAKRDIALLRRAEACSGGRVTALDVSMERNRAALLALLQG